MRLLLRLSTTAYSSTRSAARSPVTCYQTSGLHVLATRGESASSFGHLLLAGQPALTSSEYKKVQWPQLQQVRHMAFPLVPARPRKFRKACRRLMFNHTIASNQTRLTHGMYGMRATASGRVSAATLETMRKVIRKVVLKSCKLWFKVNPNVPVTQRPPETRMGKGKAAVDHYVTPIRPGQIVLEMDNISKKTAQKAVIAASHVMPMKLALVSWA